MKGTEGRGSEGLILVIAWSYQVREAADDRLLPPHERISHLPLIAVCTHSATQLTVRSRPHTSLTPVPNPPSSAVHRLTEVVADVPDVHQQVERSLVDEPLKAVVRLRAVDPAPVAQQSDA